MASPLITVGIPTIGRQPHLAHAIASLRAQTHADWVGIVADNANNPETAAHVAAYADPRLRYVGHPVNRGMFGNFNAIFELADTAYCAILHDDDRYAPEYLARMLAAMQANPTAKWGFCNATVVQEVTSTTCHWSTTLADTIFPADGSLLRRMVNGACICCPTVLFHRDVYRAYPFDPSLRYSGDWQLFLTLAQRFDAAYVGEPLLRYYEWDGNASNSAHNGFLMQAEDLRIYQQLLAMPELADAAPAIQRRLKKKLHRFCRSILTLPDTVELAPYDTALAAHPDGITRLTRWVLHHSPARRLLRPLATAYLRRQATRGQQKARASIIGALPEG